MSAAWLLRRFVGGTQPRSSSCRGVAGLRRLRLEPLEQRRLLDAYGVTSLADDGSVGTLRWAIDQANGHAGPDEIGFAPELTGTITLGGTQLSISDPVVINGPGPQALTVDGNQTSRVFKVDDGDSFTSLVVAISGLTITGGLAAPGTTEHGGGIHNRENLTLTDCVVTANATADQTISSYAGGYGGGVYNFRVLTMSNCTVSNNTTGDGGPNGGWGGLGGGLYNDGTLTMSNCTVSNNTTGDGGSGGGYGGRGGGLYSSGTLTMTQCTVSDNTTGDGRNGGASGNGGGLYNSGMLSIANSTISGNRTGEDGKGGGIHLGMASGATIRSTTICENYVLGTGSGAGIYEEFGSLDLESTVLARNLGTFGPDFYGDIGANPSAEYCLIGNNKDCNTFFPAADPGTNIIGTNPDPIDPLLGPLADNGGPTKTHALLPGSPAIDHGANTQGLSHDQRGAPFVREWPTGQPDIGACERQTATIPPLVVDTLVDESDGDFGPGDLSLREVLALANGSVGADTINFAEGLTGSIVLSSGALPIREDVTINGPGPATLAVDGNYASRVFLVDDSTGAWASVAISGLTITRGTPPENHRGGGIYSNEDLTLDDCVITDNATADLTTSLGHGGDGGGIFSEGALTMINCTVSNNTTGDGHFTGGYGGGVFSFGTLTMSNCTVSGNATGDGIGGHAGSGGRGGGVYASGSATMTACTVSDNTTGHGAIGGSGGYGGGVFSVGTLIMTACTVSGNTTGEDATGGSGEYGGGGVFSEGTLTMTNCTVSGNSAAESTTGGGVFYSPGSGGAATIQNSTIYGNQVQGSFGRGGGICHYDGTLDLQSTIVAGNTAGQGPDFYREPTTAADPHATSSLVGNNLDSDFGAAWPNPDGDGNYIGQPGQVIDPKLFPLDNYGGPTKTHALRADSIAVDHGYNPGGMTTDQRGEPFARDYGAAADIGAYERQAADIPPLVVDTLVDEIDGDYGPGDRSLREAIGLANGSVGLDEISFSPGLFEGGPATIRLELGRLMINDDVTINGPGANLLAIDGQGNSRLLAVADLAPASQTQVLISGVHLAGGDAGGGNGGGINNFEAITLSGCMISGCHAEYGGAIYIAPVGSLVIENSTLFANSATLDGGAIENNGELTVLSSTISGNEAGRYGGGIDYWDGALEVRHSTIAGNFAALYGGGLFSSLGTSGTAHLWSTIVADNAAPSGGPDIYNDLAGSSSFNLVGDGSGMGGITDGVGGNQVGADAMLLPLRDYGGPTPTRALRAGSPAIDQGASTPGIELDQRGILRTIDVAGVSNADDGTDVGAFETQGQPLTFTVTITEDENDGNFAPDDLSLREAVALANGNDWDDAIDFDLPPGEHTITLTMGELPITDDVTITGLGADVLAVHGNHASRIFKVDDGDDVGASPAVSISGLTITGGLPAEGEYGGGIDNREHLTLTGCVIRDNATRDRTTPGMDAGWGGGIFNWGTLTITACMVSGNRTGSGADNPGGDGGSGGNGGGITSYFGNLTVTDSIMSSNRTGHGGSSTSNYDHGGNGGMGGGIWARGGNDSITIHNCTVRDNTTGNGGDSAVYMAGNGGSGGGILLDLAPSATITNCTIARNTTGTGGAGAAGGDGGQGGGIANWADLTISTSTLAENRTGDGGANGGAGGRGAGLVSWSSTFAMDHCTVADNRTGDGDAGGGNGGGLALAGTVRVINSTLTGNTAGAGAAGGAVYHDTFYMGVGVVEFYNTTIYDNEVLGSGNGGGMYFHHGDMVLHSTILAGNRAANGPDLYLDPVGTPPATAIASHSLIGDNTDSGLPAGYPDADGNYIGTSGAPLDPLLGPLADNGGTTMTHALMAGSVALDHGSNPEGLVYDQRGAPFVREWPGAEPDIGAYEWQPPFDFGDAPDSYSTRLPDGARHAIVDGGPFMGREVDSEPDGQPTMDAQGDDLDVFYPPSNDDEDGVAFSTLITPGRPDAGVAIDMTGYPGPASVYLSAWMDFNGDGNWSVPGEQIFADESLTAGVVNLLTFAVPEVAQVGSTYARFRVNSTGGLSPQGYALDGEVEDYLVEIHGTVASRHIFYNNSPWDGNDPNPNAADDLAIAPDKRALLPGTPTNVATFENYTSYSRGINGIMIDIAGLANPDELNIDNLGHYFEFHVGNDQDPDSWSEAPRPTGATVRESPDAPNAKRVTITWKDYAIRNQWLQVTVLADADYTGLTDPDVFYFGNAVGESGNSDTDAIVDEIDVALARDNPHNFFNPATVTCLYDYNRDARVNATDVLIARSNQTTEETALKLIHPPALEGEDQDEELLMPTSLEEHPASSAMKLDARLGKWAWLYEFEQMKTSNWPSEKHDPAGEAVDKLLATYWP